MRILSLFLLTALVLPAWGQEYRQADQDLAHLFDSIPTGVAPNRTEGYVERLYIACQTTKLQLYGVLSADGNQCIVLNQNGTLNKTSDFSPLFPDATSLNTSYPDFMLGNSSLAPNYWQLNNDTLCYVQTQPGLQYNCLAPNNDSLVIQSPNGANIHDESSPDNCPVEGCESLKMAFATTTLVVILLSTIVIIANVMVCKTIRKDSVSRVLSP